VKIAVVGCGAVGSYYGTKLACAGHEVHFLLRSDYEIVRREGVRIQSPDGDFEVRPTTPWNYGLVLDPDDPGATISLAEQKPPAEQPFAPEAAPLVLRARAKRLPQWKAEGKMVGKIPPGPVVSSDSETEVTLIPMGCARLRISSFPLIARK